MSRKLIPSLLAVVAAIAFTGTGASLAAADAVPAATAIAVDVTQPESAVLLPAKVLRQNDFKSFFTTLPAEDQTKAVTQWKEAQEKAKAGIKPQDLSKVNDLLAKLLAPDAVDTLMKQAEPGLANIKPAELATQLQQGAMILPMLFSQAQPGQTPEQTRNKQLLGQMLSGLLTDASAWVPTSGIDDPKKLRSALEHLVAGAKGLGVKTVEELQALPFDEFLGRISPLVKEAKLAAAVYDIQIDQFLDSVTAKPAAGAAPAAGDDKPLTVGFTAFAKPYTLPVMVTKKDGHWVISPKNGEAFGGVKQMMGGAPAGD